MLLTLTIIAIICALISTVIGKYVFKDAFSTAKAIAFRTVLLGGIIILGISFPITGIVLLSMYIGTFISSMANNFILLVAGYDLSDFYLDMVQRVNERIKQIRNR